jgi:predicted transcriptional regulator
LKLRKRSKFELYGDILEAITSDIRKNNSARLTRVHGRVNVPYDRFKGYIADLKEKNLIEVLNVDDHEELKLTNRAKEYIDEYTHVKKFMITFGLQEEIKDLE